MLEEIGELFFIIGSVWRCLESRLYWCLYLFLSFYEGVWLIFCVFSSCLFLFFVFGIFFFILVELFVDNFIFVWVSLSGFSFIWEVGNFRFSILFKVG